MQKNKFWEFKNKKEDTNIGELMLYGDISSQSWWGDEVTPKTFKQELDSLGDIKTLNIYINSGGGDVFAGQAIHSMLKRKQCQKNVYIDGLAASIASVIAMAGDKVVMPKNAMMMIHKAWTIAAGNSDDFRKMADDMDKIDESIISTYEGKTNKTKDEILALMEAETWLTAEDAVKNGFADEIEEEKQVAASIGGFFMGKYKNIPENLKNAIQDNEEKPKPNEDRVEEDPEPVSDIGQEEQTGQETAIQAQQKQFKQLKLKLLGGI